MKLLFTLLITILCAHVNAQTFAKTLRINDPQYDLLEYTGTRDLIAARDGGKFICGYNSSNGNDKTRDMFLMKLNKKDFPVWYKSIGFPALNEEATAAVATSDNGYFVTGVGTDTSAKSYGIFTRIDENGNVLWSKSYRSAKNITPVSACLYKTTTFLVLAYEKDEQQITHPFILRLSDKGNLIDYYRLELPFAYATAKKIIQTSDGDYMVVLTGSNDPSDYFHTIICRLNASFQVKWCKTYGTGKRSDVSNDILETADHSFALAGTKVNVTGAVTSKLTVSKINAGGDMLWHRLVGGSQYKNQSQEKGYKIAETPEGDFIAAGITNASPNRSGVDLYFTKFSTLGELSWIKYISLDELTEDLLGGILKEKDNTYRVAGTSPFNKQGSVSVISYLNFDQQFNICLPTYNEGFVETDDIAGTDVALAITKKHPALTDENFPLITLTGKFGPKCTEENIKGPVAESKSFQNLIISPNPAHSYLNVQFTSPGKSAAFVEVYNVNGTKVIQQKITAATGFNTYRLDISRLVNGMYTLKTGSDTYGIVSASFYKN